jgi:hypothetical protein
VTSTEGRLDVQPDEKSDNFRFAARPAAVSAARFCFEDGDGVDDVADPDAEPVLLDPPQAQIPMR